MLKRILVKDYNHRIDWKELFEYTITEQGDIYAPGVTPGSTGQQFGLRASIRNSSGFGSGLNFSNNSHTSTHYSSHNSSANDSNKGNSPLLSPKPNKEGEDARNYLMKKKSPLKIDESVNNNGSINYSNNFKGEQFSKNDRNNRFDLLLKNHGKCSTLNQMILDLFRLDQPKCLYIAYYLFKSIEK